MYACKKGRIYYTSWRSSQVSHWKEGKDPEKTPIYLCKSHTHTLIATLTAKGGANTQLRV